MIKLHQLKQKSQRTINKIARINGITPEEVLRRMLRTSAGQMVTSHLDYGIRHSKKAIAY